MRADEDSVLSHGNVQYRCVHSHSSASLGRYWVLGIMGVPVQMPYPVFCAESPLPLSNVLVDVGGMFAGRWIVNGAISG